jgi:hypothetical protein
MIQILVPLMLFTSSVLMALAWLGHIRFRSKGFVIALLLSWFLVLPEYALNVGAMRLGHGIYTEGAAIYTAAEMAALNLCSGVICVALVSRFYLKERLNRYQITGFVLMAVAILLVVGT